MKERITIEQWESLTPAQKKKLAPIDLIGASKTGLPTFTRLIEVLLNEPLETKTMLLRAMHNLFMPQIQVHKITGKPVGVTCNAEAIDPVDLLFKIIKEKV